jgi:hypothetical protein
LLLFLFYSKDIVSYQRKIKIADEGAKLKEREVAIFTAVI